MKVIIDKTPLSLSEDEQQELFDDVFVREVEGHEEEFKREMEGVHTVIIPEEVKQQMEAVGLSVDFVVSQILKKAGKVN